MSLKSWFERNFPPLEVVPPPLISSAAAATLRKRAVRAPSREEFAAWRDDATTRFVFRALERAEDAQQEQWLHASWAGGVVDPLLLRELQTRADAYAAMQTATYEGFCEWAGVEPESEEAAA